MVSELLEVMIAFCLGSFVRGSTAISKARGEGGCDTFVKLEEKGS